MSVTSELVAETDKACMRLSAPGLLEVTYGAGAVVTLEDAEQIVAAGRRLIPAGERFLHLIDISGTRQMTKAARDFFAGDYACERALAIALVAASRLSTMIGNFFIGFSRPIRPFRLFSSREKALAWLLTHQSLDTAAGAQRRKT
jgi:hypothetical protein